MLRAVIYIWHTLYQKDLFVLMEPVATSEQCKRFGFVNPEYINRGFSYLRTKKEKHGRH
jgi:hypothetical protein